ncbi:hypothetical protein DL93DRAFT_2073700 [Clavulina sp. PMI_390]|nr:hypothetical protein DL93DRAFT_2073700 [Clavulina sp. PMI_390]
MDKFGRVYIPATKQCLGVPNADTNGPYTVKAMSCPNSSAGEMTTAKSIPFNWVNSRGYISWVGSTFENKTHVQGGCALGSFGYLEDPTTREPITNKTSGEYNVKLVCTYSGATAEQGSAFWTR